MKRQVMVITLAVVCIALAVTGGTLAYFSTQARVTNAVTTGKIDIDLVEKFDPNEAKNLAPTNPDNPKKITKEVHIQNQGNDAFVRVSIEKSWGVLDKKGIWTKEENLATDNIGLYFKPGTAWQEIDGDYYIRMDGAKGGVPSKTDLLLESFAFLSGKNDKLYEEKEAHIDVYAEAIQTTNQAMEAQWGITYDPKTGVFSKGAPSEVMVVSSDETTEITLQKASDKLAISFETSKVFPLGGLFGNFEEVEPGDIREQKVALANRSDEEASLYLVMQVAEQDQAMQDKMKWVEDLLYSGFVQLKITTVEGQDVLYDGMLGGNTLESIPLGKLQAGYGTELQLTLTVDPAMGNEYQALLAKVDWLIEVQWTPIDKPKPPTDEDEDDEDPVTPPIKPVDPTIPPVNPDEEWVEVELPDEPGDTNTTDPSDKPTPDTKITLEDIPNQKPLPQTGDTFPIGWVILLGACSVVGIGSVCISIKKKTTK